MSAISPIKAIRLVIDDVRPVKLRGADSFNRDHTKMEPELVSGEYPLHVSDGWTCSWAKYNDPDRGGLLALMSGSWAPSLESTTMGRSSSRPGSATGTGLLASYTNTAFPADGSGDFSLSSGHFALDAGHPEAMDRWYVSDHDHNPDTPIKVTFKIPPGIQKGDGCFMQIYHAGPTGCKNGKIGSGMYCTQLMLDGSARLWELNPLGTEWFEQARFLWTDVPPIGMEQTILILPKAYYNDDTWCGSYIDYVVQWPKSNAGTFIGALSKMAALLITKGNLDKTIQVPIHDGSATVAQPIASKVMIEVRRDVPTIMHVSHETQIDTTFDDASFMLYNGDAGTTADYPLTIWANAVVPTGATLEIDLYGYNPTTETWSACSTASGSLISGYWGVQKQVVLLAGCNRYKMRFHCGVNTWHRGPTVKDYGCHRPAAFRMTETTPMTIKDAGSVKITDIVIEYGEDVTQETAKVVLVEDGRYSSIFDLRSKIPIRIEADVLDPRDMTTLATCILFVGRVESAPSEVKFIHLNDDQDGPAYERVLICLGEGRRLARQLTQHSLNLVNSKVTDAIKALLGEQGIPSDGANSMFDVPNWSMKLMPFEKNNIGFVEMMSDVYGPVRTLVEDWLGAMLRYDLGAVPTLGSPLTHKYGMFRVLAKPQGTETPLAHFVAFPPPFDGQEGEKSLESYKSYVDPNITTATRVPYILIEQDGYLQNVVGPDFNQLIVTGAGLQNLKVDKGTGYATFTGTKPKSLSAVLHNYRSARFKTPQPVEPDPTSCDWMDEVVTYYECNTGYSSRQVVENVAKVKMRIGGQGYYLRQFQSPFWPVWNYSDLLQARPRRLEFGDVVDFSLVPSATPAPFIVAKPKIWITQEEGGMLQARYYFILQSPQPDWPVNQGDDDV